MKKVIIFTLVMVIAVVFSTGAASAKTSDLQLAKNWAKAHYSEPIKVVNEFKVPSKRKGTTYIEKVRTVSDGGTKGHTVKGKYFVKYPKKVKKGKKVTMYLVWNPKNNACDDVVAVVCLGMIK